MTSPSTPPIERPCPEPPEQIDPVEYATVCLHREATCVLQLARTRPSNLDYREIKQSIDLLQAAMKYESAA